MSSLSTSLYGSSPNKGIGGLMSGLDTDELVKQMTAATRNKINRQYQSKQKLSYRQEAYREISTKLLSFSNKYFSYSSGSKTNILSPKFFEANSFKSSSNYVNVTGNAENIKNFSIDSISSVATAANFSSSKKVTGEVFNSSDITKYTSSLAGETFSIKYDGITYNLSLSKDLGKGKLAGEQERQVYYGDVVADLNKQLATIKDKDGNLINSNNEILKYKLSEPDNGKYKIEFDISENRETAELTAASTDFLNVLKMKVGSEASSDYITRGDLTRTAEEVILDGSITFEFNGVTKKINLSEMSTKKSDGSNYTYDSDGISEFLQNELSKEFGLGKVKVDVIGKQLTFQAEKSTDIFGISSISTELSYFIGLEQGDYNRVNKNVAIEEANLKTNLIESESGGYEIKINEKIIKIEKGTSLSDIIKKINNDSDVIIYHSSTTDTFTVKAKDTGEHKSVLIEDLNGGNLAEALFGKAGVDGDYVVNKGTDTEMSYTLNGVPTQITRSTANFTIDEINIELNEKASTIDFTNNNKVTFDVTNNSDEVVERVKEFINEYNEIINLIGTKTSEKPKRDYLPLTPEQQDEMEEEEIKNWNIEAKKGVLYGDRKMNNMLRSMREAMSGLTDVSSITLSSIGIASASMDTSGKLVLDETKFKQKLLENPDEIANLFTLTSSKEGDDAKSGIALQLQDILRDNVGAYGTTGLLIDEAGMPNSMTSDRNYISEKMKEYDDKMTELKRDLETERKRYWDQFSALESSLNKLNAQSGWLTDMMGQ